MRNPFSRPLSFAGLLCSLLFLLVACGGGGGGGSPLSISLSPSSVSASIPQGRSYAIQEIATVTGSVSGTVYIGVLDHGNAIEPPVTIVAIGNGSFAASANTDPSLAVGEHKGSLEIALCADDACSSRYGDTSLPYDFTVIATPQITNISPGEASAGGPAFSLTVDGSDFVPASSVQWDGSPRTTTYVSPTELKATITQADLAASGSHSISVDNHTPDAISLDVPFVVQAVQPVLDSIGPPSLLQGSPAQSVLLTGSGFVLESAAQWDGSLRATTYVSATQLKAQLTQADLASGGVHTINVNNLGAGGTSAGVNFTVQYPVPVLSSLSPSSLPAGSAAFTLTVAGSNFVPSSVVDWNGGALTTSYVSSKQLTAQVTAADVASGTGATVSVDNAGLGGVSNTQSFTLRDPSANKLTPSVVNNAGAGFTLTVDGADFLSGATVLWDGAARTTTYVSSTRVTALISAADIAAVGNHVVSVANDSQGANSGTLTLQVQYPAPALSSLGATSANAGGVGFNLTVNGSGFRAASTVRWNGSARPTTYNSATQLTAQISAADIANGAVIPVSVLTPAPGGGQSASLNFTVNNPVPTLGSINSASAAAGCGGFTLYVMGKGFVPSSVVHWNGAARATSFISSSALAAQVTAADIAKSGGASVSVTSPTPAGGTSGNAAFTITATTPATTEAVSLLLNPTHDGVATTACPLNQPTAAAWTHLLGGEPAYPLIADGKVYATTVLNNNNPASLTALDPASGAVLWGPVTTSSSGTSYDAGRLFQIKEADGPCCTSGLILSSYDAATGTPGWTTNLTGEVFVNTATTAANGMVYSVGQESGGILYAVRESDGKQIWTAGLDIGDTSAPIVTAGGVYLTYQCNTYAFVPATGASLWTYPSSCGGGGGLTSLVANGQLYSVDSGSNYSGHLLNAGTGAVGGTWLADVPPAVGPSYGYFLRSGVLRAMVPGSGSAVWSFSGDGNLVSSPILVNQTVLIASSSGLIYALDAGTGQQLWSIDVGDAVPGGVRTIIGYTPTLTVGDNLLVVPAGNNLVGYKIAAPKP